MNIRFCTCGHTSLHHQRDSLERMACLDCECIEYDDYTEVWRLRISSLLI